MKHEALFFYLSSQALSLAACLPARQYDCLHSLQSGGHAGKRSSTPVGSLSGRQPGWLPGE